MLSEKYATDVNQKTDSEATAGRNQEFLKKLRILNQWLERKNESKRWKDSKNQFRDSLEISIYACTDSVVYCIQIWKSMYIQFLKKTHDNVSMDFVIWLYMWWTCMLLMRTCAG